MLQKRNHVWKRCVLVGCLICLLVQQVSASSLLSTLWVKSKGLLSKEEPWSTLDFRLVKQEGPSVSFPDYTLMVPRRSERSCFDALTQLCLKREKELGERVKTTIWEKEALDDWLRYFISYEEGESSEMNEEEGCDDCSGKDNNTQEACSLNTLFQWFYSDSSLDQANKEQEGQEDEESESLASETEESEEEDEDALTYIYIQLKSKINEELISPKIYWYPNQLLEYKDNIYAKKSLFSLAFPRVFVASKITDFTLYFGLEHYIRVNLYVSLSTSKLEKAFSLPCFEGSQVVCFISNEAMTEKGTFPLACLFDHLLAYNKKTGVTYRAKNLFKKHLMPLLAKKKPKDQPIMLLVYRYIGQKKEVVHQMTLAENGFIRNPTPSTSQSFFVDPSKHILLLK